MFKDYKLYWQNYFNFKGHTPRRGYWFPFLINAAVGILLSLIFVILSALIPIAADGTIPIVYWIIMVIAGLVSLATLIPSLSVSIRRLHDTGRRWFWLAIPVAPYLFMVAFTLAIFIQVAVEVDVAAAFATALAGLIVLLIIVGILGLLSSAFWIILMALPSSGAPIGSSTHQAATIGKTKNKSKPGTNKGSSSGINISGVHGMYRGYDIPIQPEEELIFGRDSAFANIIIDQNATKVSRKHCGIAYDPVKRTFFVRDYSSNGTFRADGSRLLANALNPVTPGTVINLGSAENSFKLG